MMHCKSNLPDATCGAAPRVVCIQENHDSPDMRKGLLVKLRKEQTIVLDEIPAFMTPFPPEVGFVAQHNISHAGEEGVGGADQLSSATPSREIHLY